MAVQSSRRRSAPLLLPDDQSGVFFSCGGRPCNWPGCVSACSSGSAGVRVSELEAMMGMLSVLQQGIHRRMDCLFRGFSRSILPSLSFVGDSTTRDIYFSINNETEQNRTGQMYHPISSTDADFVDIQVLSSRSATRERRGDWRRRRTRRRLCLTRPGRERSQARMGWRGETTDWLLRLNSTAFCHC